MQNLTFPDSDHVPILLNLHGERAGRQGRRRHPWRFNAHWVRNEECDEVIHKGWESAMDPDCFDILFGGIEACQLEEEIE